MKIVFYIESLRSGGKERRMIELIKYLKKNDFDIYLILMDNEIHFKAVIDLNVRILFLKRKFLKKDPILFLSFFKLVKKIKPDIIHVWGNMPAFYALPYSIIMRVPLINSQITNAPEKINKYSFFYLSSCINFLFSKYILSNSIAGLNSYKPPKNKSFVIYNGVDLNRFNINTEKNLIKKIYKIKAKYAIVMVGTFSKNKDFEIILDVAILANKNGLDLNFVLVGDGPDFYRINNRKVKENINNVILTGKVDNVEEIISCCDIGILLSPNGEGISNAIIEYMALAKPVIANNKGGTRELVINNYNGILLENYDKHEILNKINYLINNFNLMLDMGFKGRKIIEEKFTFDKMGENHLSIYKKSLHESITYN